MANLWIYLSLAAGLFPAASFLIKRAHQSVRETGEERRAAARVLYADGCAAAKPDASAALARNGFEWQPVQVEVTYDSVRVSLATPFYAFNPYAGNVLDRRIPKLKILRRSTEETPRGTAVRLRYRDEQREVREIELVPSDRSRFLKALAAGVE